MTTKSKGTTGYTPGPWEKRMGVDVDTWDIYGNADAPIHGKLYLCHVEKNEADANLIAAAPETAAERDRLREVNGELVKAGISLALEARHLINTKHGGEFLLDRVKNMETAIRKAEGGE